MSTASEHIRSLEREARADVARYEKEANAHQPTLEGLRQRAYALRQAGEITADVEARVWREAAAALRAGMDVARSHLGPIPDVHRGVAIGILRGIAEKFEERARAATPATGKEG